MTNTDDTVALAERPTVCPKGHDLWFFSHDCSSHYRWAVCDGCKHVWLWMGHTEDALRPCYGYDPEKLVMMTQALGALLGRFTRKHSRAVEASRYYTE